jgi:nicotinamidase-related amidase
MLSKEDAVLVVVDVQGKLAHLMADKVSLFSSLHKTVTGVRLLDVPVIWMEQLPEKLGPTIDEVRLALTDHTPIAKSSFSCCGSPGFQAELARLGRKQIILVGIEAHICVYQTAVDLLAAGYEVTIVVDAVSSRQVENKNIALQRLSRAGVLLSCTEMLLFELQRVAEGDVFKKLAALIK